MASYASIVEFKASPSHGIDCTQLLPAGDAAANDAALQTVLDVATDWVNAELGMDSLATGTHTETMEYRLDRRGQISVYPRNFPITGVTSVQYRTFPSNTFTTLDVASYIDVYPTRFVLRGLTMFSLSANLVTMQDVYSAWYRTPSEMDRLSRVPIMLQYSYTSGYSTIPAGVKQACIIYAASLIKERGSVSVTMEGTPSTMGGNPYGDKSLDMARELLRPYKRLIRL